ncbi:MAG TPA: F0F1 ATP synthase subunit A [Candidatus Tectomicrobia bacterium]|nr:F0F1 ATP synthase subunit A [Candidatus Tectomicrobia bacterium]
MKPPFLYVTIPGLELYPHVTYMWLTMLLLLAIAYLTTRRLQTLPGTAQGLMELVVGGLLSFMERVMGHHAKAHAPVIGGIVLFIVTANLLGNIPGLFSATANINITAGCAISIFLYYQYIGFRRHGLAYIKQFTGPIWWLAPLMLPIELISHVIRPFTLALRLFANMMGHEIVLIILTLLVPLIAPLPIVLLGIFVSFIQGFVFMLLSMIYIAGAEEEHH